MTLVVVLNYSGVVASAMRAALTVTLRGRDLVAAVLLAAVAGVGGGTVRDLLIGAPVFWVHDQTYLAACMVPTALVWFFGVGHRGTRWLDVGDALGLGAYAVTGCLKAKAAGVPLLAAGAVGAITAVWGGLMREMLAGEPTVLTRKEIYITAALLACVVFIGGAALGLPATPAALVGGAAGAGLRLLAVWRAFEMPPPPWCPRDEGTD